MDTLERDMAKKKSDEPQHPFLARIPEELFRRLEALAVRHERTTNKELVYALKLHVERCEAEEKEGER
jgi:hypothetical protein